MQMQCKPLSLACFTAREDPASCALLGSCRLPVQFLICFQIWVHAQRATLHCGVESVNECSSFCGCRGRFWVDLFAWVPLDIIAIMFVQPCSQRTAQYLSLLRLAHMVTHPVRTDARHASPWMQHTAPRIVHLHPAQLQGYADGRLSPLACISAAATAMNWLLPWH